MATETPKYKILQQDGDFEVRQYEPRIVAEVSVDGEMDTATREGFRILAGYIFGDNHNATPQQVTVSAEAPSKIAMTAPVSIEPLEASSSFTTARAWRVEFTMPSQYTMTTLPKPNNPAVRLRTVEPHFVASIRFSGFTTASSIEAQTRLLQSWITKQKLEAIGQAQVARYNDPFTLPWNRRNEILIPVKQ